MSVLKLWSETGIKAGRGEGKDIRNTHKMSRATAKRTEMKHLRSKSMQRDGGGGIKETQFHRKQNRARGRAKKMPGTDHA